MHGYDWSRIAPNSAECYRTICLENNIFQLASTCVIKIYRNCTSLVFVIIKTPLRTTDGHGYYCNYLYLLYECNR